MGKSKAAKTALKSDAKKPQLYGEMVRLLNLSGVDYYCPISGKKIGARSMAVRYNGVYYSSWKESERAAMES